MNVHPDVNFEELARSTNDFNGAQLKGVFVEAGMLALRRDATETGLGRSRPNRPSCCFWSGPDPDQTRQGCHERNAGKKERVPGVEAVAGGAAVAWLAYGDSGRCCGGSNGGERDLFSVAFSLGNNRGGPSLVRCNGWSANV
ncbi:hypothetical protein NC653_030376 [Populus alba x Populus x berolinensis]|uniref:AAA ATPase AAA+ lid domain-containing protein n=1 Tax=Populus alba x Populus x berolinensis TaxID=444605 RepID=A0AAD6LW60_9ROSI|nr:hypothetical protein NC653_030376 [Populus alba x Populus x berolinensis]